MQLTSRELFGGAVVADIPSHYLDASDLRQVPDTQEVFLSPTDDTSVIFEILESVTEGNAGSDLWEAARFHFDALAHDNAASSSSVTSVPPSSNLSPHTLQPPYTSTLPSSLQYPTIPTPPPTILSGKQSIRKFSSNKPLSEQAPPDEVMIVLALWRIMLPSADRPERCRKADVVASVNVNLSEGIEGPGSVDRKGVEEWFRQMARSLRIMDYGLFVES